VSETGESGLRVRADVAFWDIGGVKIADLGEKNAEWCGNRPKTLDQANERG
jgi:hypothetical protein